MQEKEEEREEQGERDILQVCERKRSGCEALRPGLEL